MAKQHGIVTFKGTIGDLSFLETKDGNQVRKKRRAPSKLALENDPKFARLRENMSEFSRTVQAAKYFRKVFSATLLDCSDKRMSTRLSKAMMKVTVSDPTSPRGKRKVMNGDASLLNGFACNISAVMETVFKTEIESGIDRVTGKCTVDIPAFTPLDKVAAPVGATHFKFHSAAAEINFYDAVREIETAETAAIRLDDVTPTPANSFVHQLTANSTGHLFLLLGIRFFQEVNGILYPLRNDAFNVLEIVAAESV